jgi:hypothetical protein
MINRKEDVNYVKTPKSKNLLNKSANKIPKLRMPISRILTSVKFDDITNKFAGIVDKLDTPAKK